MAATTVTTKAKKKMLLARAGLATLPTISGFAFGTGGVNAQGQIIPHSPSDNALYNEVLRKPVYSREAISDTRMRYSCVITESQLVGVEISECGLYDTAGDFVALKSFAKKSKDPDLEVVFEVDDMF